MPLMPPISDNDKGVCERAFFAGFMRENSPILDETRMNTIYDSMDHPITDYWIASSHNTYLEGDQESISSDYLFSHLIGRDRVTNENLGKVE